VPIKPRFSLTLPFVLWVVAAASATDSPARAASDPARQWASVASDHFVVHYYDGGREFAVAVAGFAEEAREVVGEVFDWYPRERVNVAVFDEGDSANGLASALPEPRLTVYAWPPPGDSELGHYGNWLKLLVFHEYAHIVHLDESHGIPDLVNAVFGRVWKPNQVLPQWIVEGIAVWAESRRTGGGRLQSGILDMWLRVFSLEDAWPTLDMLGGFPLKIPRGTLWYLLGGHIIDTMVDAAGVEGLAAFSDAYSARVLPFAIQGLARQSTGRTWDGWYSMFRATRAAAVRESVRAVEAAGVVEGEVFRTVADEVDHLRFSPDGAWLYWVENDGHSQGRIVRAPTAALTAGAGHGPVETIALCYGGCNSMDISRDGGTVAFTTRRFSRVGNYFGSIATVPAAPAGGRRDVRVLPGTQRAHDVAFDHDGRSVWAVRAGWGRTWLERFELATGRSVERVDPPRGLDGLGQYPRFERPTSTPAGLFAIIHARGNRDIWRAGPLAADGVRAPWSRWTIGGADEVDLQLCRGSADSAPRLVYAADRAGVVDIYAMSLVDRDSVVRSVVRLTRARVGALNPALSPDAKVLAYTRPTASGRSIMALQNPLATAMVAPAEAPLRSVETAPAITVDDRPYDAMTTLTPRRWLPSSTFGSAGPGRVGLALSHVDASHRFETGLSFDWDFALADWFGTARAAWRGGFVDLTADLGRYTYDRGSVVGDLEEPYLQEIIYASFFAGIPVPDAFAGLFWGIGYTLELAHGARVGALQHRPDETTPFIPREGLSGFVNIALSWSDIRGFLYSPGPADGWSGQFNLALRDPALGSSSESYTATMSLRGSLQMPWHDDHVLALRLGAGIAGGPGASQRAFSLGGAPNRDILSDLLNQSSAGAVWLRGFPAYAFQGQRFALGTVEYRLPIARIRRGLGTLPLFVEDLALAVFVDAGGTAMGEEAWPTVHASVGAELRVRLGLGWGLLSDFRLGYARGIGPLGVDSIYLWMAGAP